MTVAFDVGNGSLRIDTSDPYTFNHTGRAEASGGIQGVVVAAMHGVTATNHVVGITYGGVALSKIVEATDTATEPGCASLWFVGSGLSGKGGLQTVSADLSSATGDDIHFHVWSLTGIGDIFVIDSDEINENAANPTNTLQSGGKTKFCMAAMYGGGAAPGGTLATGNSIGSTRDLGAFYSQTCHETTVDNADHTIGWSTLATDDLAFVSIAVSDVATLVVADALHAHAADGGLALVQHNVLAPADALHAHAADALVLTQHNILVVQDALHAHAADSLALTQHNVLAVQDALHAHAADNIVLTAHNPGASLTVQDALHAHAADNIVLTQHNVLVVQDAAHGHSADNVVLTVGGEPEEPERGHPSMFYY